jgi:hypothetical protein
MTPAGRRAPWKEGLALGGPALFGVSVVTTAGFVASIGGSFASIGGSFVSIGDSLAG